MKPIQPLPIPTTQAAVHTPALISLSLAMLLSSLGTSSANIALPALAQAFHASFQSVQWVVLAYLIAITALIVGAGRLGDLFGRKRLFLLGLLLFTLASSLCGLAPTLGLLIAARTVQGLGAAIIMSLSMALISEAVPKEKTGSAMGLLGTMSAIGTALGPTLGGLLISVWDWRAIFLIKLPLGLLTYLLAWRCLPQDHPFPERRPIRFDYPGTLLLALSLSAYALAMTLGHGHLTTINLVLLVAAACGIKLFLVVESKATFALIDLRLLRQPTLGAGLAMSALVTPVVMATLVLGPFYLGGALQLDSAQVGLVMSCGPIASALTGAPAGRLTDRFGSARITIAGLVLMASACIILPWMPLQAGIPGYIAPLVVITTGYALFQAANNSAIMRQSYAGQRGLIAGMLNLSRNLGLITGAALMGGIFAMASASTQGGNAAPDAIGFGMRITFAVATVFILFAAAIAWVSQASKHHQAR